MCANKPLWLPDIVVDVACGSSEKIFNTLLSIFERDFISGKPCFEGLNIIWDRKIEDGFENGFWHLISKNDPHTKVRLLEPRRAERLPWARPLLDNFNDATAVKFWDYQEKPNIVRTYLWLEKLDYVLILEKKLRIKKAFIVTAYFVDGKSTIRRLNKKWAKRITNAK